MSQISKTKIKVPLPGEEVFVVRIKSPFWRKLFLSRYFISEIKLSPSAFKNGCTEETWSKILSSYSVNGKICDNYIIERGFESLDEVWDYLLDGGRITNLDESCDCYVLLVNDQLIFNNGEIVDGSIVIDHPTSWHPFYPTLKMIDSEPTNLIKGLLKVK